MNCPICNNYTTKVVTGVNNHTDNERYRQRKCMKCGHIFYTGEFEVEASDDFIIDVWNYYQRENQKARREKYNEK